MSDEIQEREVARRVFAAEFDDATLSYSESDEERAPNYVVTPTGARVNRLFAVGALTEVESVNDDVLRGRIADPTGAFVTYAGQYQPDAAAFLERAAPPCFVSITGKGRTYQPEDGERIFTSVRPESFNEVDADTRDRWLVTAATATFDRLATMAAALDLDARDDDLRTELESRGVDSALANGVALAIDHYRPTEHYLEAVRRLTVRTLELVAGDRESVETLEVDPGESGPDELGPLPAVAAATPPSAGADGTNSVPASESAPESRSSPASASADADGQPTAGDSSLGETATPAQDAADAADTASAASASDTDTADSDPAPGAASPASISDDGSEEADSTGAGGTTHADDVDTAAGTHSAPSTTETGVTDASDTSETPTEPAGTDAPSDLGDGPSGGSGDSDASPGEDGVDDLGDFGADDAPDGAEMYELDDDERAEIESEFGTEFATGNEVDDPGEADIDVPDVEDLEAEAAAAADPDAVEAGDPVTGADGSPPTPDSDTAAGTDAGEPTGASSVSDETAAAGGDTDPTGAAAEPDATEAAADIDIEAAAVDVMSELDDGDGAEREAVVSAVVDEHGVAPDAVEDAIQEALMGGKCYEPAEGRLKAI